tara:strand:+ start:4238 stop:4423 length:186 start_codon:yes stop_codon:yes gene_type:complete
MFDTITLQSLSNDFKLLKSKEWKYNGKIIDAIQDTGEEDVYILFKGGDVSVTHGSGQVYGN